jgi:hypothetical protein
MISIKIKGESFMSSFSRYKETVSFTDTMRHIINDILINKIKVWYDIRLVNMKLKNEEPNSVFSQTVNYIEYNLWKLTHPNTSYNIQTVSEKFKNINASEYLFNDHYFKLLVHKDIDISLCTKNINIINDSIGGLKSQR